MIQVRVPFNERLKEIMDKKGVRAVDLAKAIGVSEGTISQYRSGYTEPKRDRLAAIATYLNVSPTYLMGIDEDVHNNDQYKRLAVYAEAIAKSYSMLNDKNKKIVNNLIDSLLEAQGDSDEG